MASSYGKGPYGHRLYSWAPTVDFSGDLTPFVNFSGAIDVVVAKGDLAGNLRPAIVLGASLTVDRVLAGQMTFGVVLAASAVFGPYWPLSEPCPSSPWAPSDLCPPPMWTPVGPCAPVDWEETVNG